MNGNRSKGAWIWVAMVAISFASLHAYNPALKMRGLCRSGHQVFRRGQPGKFGCVGARA